MTVNLISDVHATLDNDLKVIYAFPQKLNFEECLDILEAEASDKDEDAEDLDPKINAAGSYQPKAPATREERAALVDSIIAKLKIWEKLDLAKKRECVKDVASLEQWHHLQISFSSKRELSAAKLVKAREWMIKSFSTFDPAKLEPADYLVIAGDLGLEPTEPAILDDIKKKTAGKFKDVFYIAGNHSHWWDSFNGLISEKPDHINLEHDYFKKEVPGNWLFLGCTLWTPIPKKAEFRIGKYMNDYRCIPGKFWPEDSSKQFEIQSTWLLNEIQTNKDKKIVVFTHHQPFPECIEDDYKHNDPWASDNVAEAYAVLDGTFDKMAEENPHVKIWLCGHTHQPFDQIVHGIRVVRNPIGYSDFYIYGFGSSECDPANWYNKVIDLGE